MIKSFSKFMRVVFASLYILVFLWFVISYIEICNKNVTKEAGSGDYSNWNLLYMIQETFN